MDGDSTAPSVQISGGFGTTFDTTPTDGQKTFYTRVERTTVQ
jgi:hypothetical protein